MDKKTTASIQWNILPLKDLCDSYKNDILDGPFGSDLKTSDYVTSGIPVLKIQNIKEVGINNKKMSFVTAQKFNELKRHSFQKNDIIMTKLGDPLGVCAIVKDIDAGVIVADLVRIRAKKIDTKYLNYYLNSPLIRNFINSQQKGTTRPRIKLQVVRSLPIIHPESDIEQKKIVEKIEELFTKIDVGVEDLKNVQVKINCYKQSLINTAFNGKLTEIWRSKNKEIVDRWELSLNKHINERIGKMSKKKKFQVLELIKSSPWKILSFDLLAEDDKHAIKAGPFGSSLKKEFYTQKGYKIYGQEQVIRNDHNFGNYYIDENRFNTLKSNAVKPGDILVSLVGTIGKILILPNEIESGIINPRLLKFSLDKGLVNPYFIKLYLESNLVKSHFQLNAHGGTMKILNLTMLKEIGIPVPPIEEQSKILKIIDENVSVIDKIEELIIKNIKVLSKLKQSILSSTFQKKQTLSTLSNFISDNLSDQRVKHKNNKENIAKGEKKSKIKPVQMELL